MSDCLLVGVTNGLTLLSEICHLVTSSAGLMGDQEADILARM